MVCRSWHPGRGGDALLVPARGWSFDTGSVPAKGSVHGTPYLCDRTAFAGVLSAFLGLERTTAAIEISRATAR